MPRVPARKGFGERSRSVVRFPQGASPYRRGRRFGTGDKRRAKLRRLRAERECGSDTAAIHEAARRDHRNIDGIHDLRHQRHRADHARVDVTDEGAAMPAGLGALRANGIGAVRRPRLGFGDVGRAADDEDARAS